MARRLQDVDTLPLGSRTGSAVSAGNNDEARQKLAENRDALAPWLNSDEYRALPGQLKLGVVHLLAEVLATADSPHTSNHVMEDTLALASHGTEFLAARSVDPCTIERLEACKQYRDKERKKLDAKAADLVLTWRCQRFPTQGMPPLELNTSEYLIPEVQALHKAGGSALQAVAEVNEDALRAEIKRYSTTLRRRVEVRRQELVRDLQRHQREQLEIRERKKLGFRKGWTHLL